MAFHEGDAPWWIAASKLCAAPACMSLVTRLYIDGDASIKAIALALENVEIPDFLHGFSLAGLADLLKVVTFAHMA